MRLFENAGIFTMSESTPLRVQSDSYLTLHYRLATLDGENIISTFDENPATLQLGTGQLAPSWKMP
jgi:FKBP-type peptidyl-prolyl cis-trans isomerase SlpA